MKLKMELPSEILMEIFKRLPVKSVYRLRCVSKTFLDLIDSRVFVLLHSRSAVAEEPLHLLRLNSSYCATTHTSFTALQSVNYDAGQGKLSSSDILSAFKRCNLHFVFNHLFCWEIKAGRDVNFFLIDPFREEVLRLPTSDILKRSPQRQYDRYYYGMGFDGITNTYKIVILFQHSKWKTCLGGQVHVVGTSSWHEIPASSVTLSLVQCYYPDSTLCAYGDMHWIFHNEVNHMISFDFTKEEFYSTPLPAAALSTKILPCFTLKGSMAIVNVDQTKAIDIWVMKDYNTKEWTREYNINLQSLGRDLKPMLHCAFYAEWENGVVRHAYLKSGTCLFFDMRHDPVSYVTCHVEGRSRCEKFWSCKWSLMSLKQMGKQVEEPEANILSMLEFSRKYLEQYSD